MKFFGVLFSLLWITGCAFFQPNPAHFQKREISTQYLTFSVWEKEGIQSGKPLRIYLEGDGQPNPTNRVALYYAEQDPSTNVIYVARPCQWSEDKICQTKPEIYQSQRFHPEIIRETEEVILLLINKFQAPSIELVGYDGGATVALNLAPRLPTQRIITIAGILDLNAFVRQNDLNEMPDAEDPMQKLGALSQIPQIHYVGSSDKITPHTSAERFVRQMVSPKSAVVKKVPDVNHSNWRGVALDY